MAQLGMLIIVLLPLLLTLAIELDPGYGLVHRHARKCGYFGNGKLQLRCPERLALSALIELGIHTEPM